MKSEILSIQRHPKYGYVIRTELVENPDPCIERIKIRKAYNTQGDYIGDPTTANFLCEKYGIKPELISPEHPVCSIGFCEQEQKWYGWSHRAIFGFGVGSSVVKGDIAYIPDNTEELSAKYTEWNEGVDTLNEDTIQITSSQCDIIGENDDGWLIVKETGDQETYEVKTGRGGWTAQTLEDARQMAIDFANNIA